MKSTSYDSTSDDVDNKVEPNTPTMPSKLFKFSCDKYSFMIAPIDSSCSESPEFLVMIQQMLSNASFFGCLEFVSESNVPPSVGLDVCPSRRSIYLILLSLGVMPRVTTAFHLPVAYIDDIIRLIAICNDIYKFAACSYNILQEFVVGSKVIVPSHPKTVRKLHVWRTNFDKMILKESTSIS